MNTENCPSGYFTDEIMKFNSPPCTEPVAGWLIFSITATVLRILIAIPIYFDIKRRMNANKKNAKFSLNSKLRVAMEFICGLFYSLFVLLTSLNIANTRNGGAPFLFALIGIPISLSYFLLTSIIIKLGKRIIPLAAVFSLDNQKTMDGLSNADFILKVTYVLLIAAAVASVVCFSVISLIFPNQPLTVELGLWFHLAFLVLVVGCSIWQIHRVISALNNQVEPDASLDRAKFILRLEQLTVLGFVVLFGSVILLVCLGVIPLHWYMVLILYFLSDLFFQAMVLLGSFLKRRKLRRRKEAVEQHTSSKDSKAVVVAKE